MPKSADAHWHTLGLHFIHHAQQVERFRSASKHAVRRMWEHQTNEALIERHCELFGVWPQCRALDAGHQVCVVQKDRTWANNEPLHASIGAILDTRENENDCVRVTRRSWQKHTNCAAEQSKHRSPS